MHFLRLRSATEPEFDALARIYAEAHPAGELKSIDALRQMIERPAYLFLAVEDAGRLMGFAIAVALAGCDAALLEYMAVSAEQRGRGIGGLLFQAVMEWPEVHDRFLLIEVDSPAIASPDAADRVRRVEFYRRLGSRQIEGLVYRMPRVSTEEPPLMNMLVYRRELPDTIDRARLGAWLEACYAQVYQQALPDPRIDTMLRELPDSIRLI